MVNRKHNLHQQWNILHGPTLSDKLYHSEYTCISMKINYTCLKLLIEIGIVTCVLLQFMFWIVLEQMTLNLGENRQNVATNNYHNDQQVSPPAFSISAFNKRVKLMILF